MVSASKPIAVIGAGPAGLGAGYLLARAGVPVTIYDASPQVGGLARSFDLWGRPAELGPHLLQRNDPRIDAIWDELIGEAYDAVPRRTRVISDGHWYKYPYDPVDILRQIGVAEPVACAVDAVKHWVRPAKAPGDDLRSWAVGRFGERAFDAFLKGYVEKLYGIPSDQVDKGFAETLAERTDLKNLVRRGVERIKQGRAEKGIARSELIVRPHGGIGVLMSKIADDIRANGGTFALSRSVSGIVIDGKRVVGLRLQSGELAEHDRIVSTMPLSLVLRCLPHVPPEFIEAAGKLKTRSVVLLFGLLKGAPEWRDQWLYLMAPDLKVCRVSSFDNFSDRRRATDSIVTIEFWCDAESEIWSASQPDLVRIALHDLKAAKILSRDQEFAESHVVKVKTAYPILHVGFRRSVDATIGWLKQHEGLHILGRAGSFDNDNIHGVLLSGMELAQSISGTKNGAGAEWGTRPVASKMTANVEAPRG